MTLLTHQQLQNCIRLVPRDHQPLCHGYRWEIGDANALAELVAWTLQGYYFHAQNILADLSPENLVPAATIRAQATNLITLPPETGNVASRWHRDGLVFQHIAWIAAQISSPGGIATSAPHPRPAAKGFDALLVPLEADNNAINGIIICEEKATEHPRNEITQNIWPGILEIEAGERDAELNNELTAILRTYGVKNLDAIIAAANWRNQKAYRVSVTCVQPDTDETRIALFAGYDACAPGANHQRRRAETIYVPNLRPWMDNFCDIVRVKIQET